MASSTLELTEYKVADLSLADWGRKEIAIAEHEMPGLMSIRNKYAAEKPIGRAFASPARSAHMTIQTAVLIRDTRVSPERKSAGPPCNIFLRRRIMQSVHRGCRQSLGQVFPVSRMWKGESLEDYWECTYKALSHKGGKGPELVVDDGGDVTLLIHKGYELEDGDNWVNTPSGNHEEQVIKDLLKRVHAGRSAALGTRSSRSGAASAKTQTTGVHRLYQMMEKGKLLIPAINVNDSVTKSKFDNLYGVAANLWPTASSAPLTSWWPARLPWSADTGTWAKAARTRCAAWAHA